MILSDVFVGISRFRPAETQLGFYPFLTKNVFIQAYRYIFTSCFYDACVCMYVCVRMRARARKFGCSESSGFGYGIYRVIDAREIGRVPRN